MSNKIRPHSGFQFSNFRRHFACSAEICTVFNTSRVLRLSIVGKDPLKHSMTCGRKYNCLLVLGNFFNFSVLDQKNLVSEGGEKKHLGKKTLNIFLEKVMRATKCKKHWTYFWLMRATKYKKNDLFLKKIIRSTKKTSQKNIAGKIFVISRNKLGFFSECFFLSPKLTRFFSEIGSNFMRVLDRKNTFVW